MVDETEHLEALEQTGFWGRQGAGCILYARSSGRYLLAFRSSDVQEPHTWGIWGGAVPTGMTIEDSVRVEVAEETGYVGTVDLLPLCEFHDVATGFRYQNYLGVVDDEFEPVLNWESEGSQWVSSGEWPAPRHFGLDFLLERCPDPASILSEDISP